MALAPGSGAPFTYEDLQDMPDDGHRRELVDGVLLVTPAPVPLHNAASSGWQRRSWQPPQKTSRSSPPP
ncbi:MAG: hypothetical protein ACR2G7_05630 [Acidimicrobiales bacterium]